MMLQIYFKDGRVFSYPVESDVKAREHMEKIWDTGYRSTCDGNLTWYGRHYIDKIKYVPMEGTKLSTNFPDECRGT